MATYRLKDPPPSLLHRRWITVLWLAASVGVSVGVFTYAGADWLRDIGKLVGLFALATAYSLWQVERQIWQRESITVRVSPEGIRRTGGSTRERFLSRDEIASIGDLASGAGFVIRSVNPRRVLIVPRDTERLDSCRAELVEMGIPVGPYPNNRWRLWTFVVVCWSIVGVFVANSRAVQIASGAICAVGLLTMWAAGWLRPAPGPSRQVQSLASDIAGNSAAQSSALPVRSTEEAAHARRTTRRVGVGLIAASVAAMIVGAWWTNGTDNFGLVFLVLCIGMMVFAGGFFAGPLRTSLLAFLVLAGSGAALGALIWWFDPSSDLGATIALSVGLLGAVALLVTLVSRQAWAVSTLEVLMGPAVIGLAFYGRFHSRTDHGVMLALGVLITLLTIGKRTSRWEPVVMKVASPLRVAAICLLLACALAHRTDLTLPGILLFCSLPDRTSRVGQTAGSSFA